MAVKRGLRVGLGKRKVPEVPQQLDSPERTEFVTRLMLAGLPVGQIVEQAARGLGLDRKATRTIYDRLCESWTADLESDLRHARARAVNRLSRDLASMRNPLPLRGPTGEVLTEAVLDANGGRLKRDGKEVRRPVLQDMPWTNINQHERLLASIEGTLRPVEVAVDITVSTRRSLAVLVATLSEEELQELEDEQRLLEESAGGVPPR